MHEVVDVEVGVARIVGNHRIAVEAQETERGGHYARELFLTEIKQGSGGSGDQLVRLIAKMRMFEHLL